MQNPLRPGANVALKVPPHQFDATLRFYREVVGLQQAEGGGENAVPFVFGALTLWVDKSPQFSQAELWLELQCDDLPAAKRHLAAHGVTRCDGIETLPPGMQAFWISSPADTVHLVIDEAASAAGEEEGAAGAAAE